MKTRIITLFALSIPAWAAGITVHPSSITLTGRNATQVIAVSAGDRDVTAESTFRLTGGATVSQAGVVTSAADGKSSLTVTWKNERAVVPVTVSSAKVEPKLSFVKDVVPIFTMAGCAGSNCHGSIRGQKGFKLSLFGYEPNLDFEAITAHRPQRSRKRASSCRSRHSRPRMAAASGSRSIRSNTARSWNGSRAARPTTAPARRGSRRSRYSPRSACSAGVGATQQLIATAKYTDGTSRDVTHLVQYTSNDPDTVQVSPDGKVKALQIGETAIMVRTLGQAVAAKIYVPQPALAKAPQPAPRNNYIDEHVFAKLERLHIEPSDSRATNISCAASTSIRSACFPRRKRPRSS